MARASVAKPGDGRRFVEWLVPLPRLAGGICYQVRLPFWKYPNQTRHPGDGKFSVTRTVNVYHEPRDSVCERCGRNLR